MGKYVLDKLQVNGVDVTSGVSNNKYTISNITENKVVTVSFKLNQFTVTCSAGSGGTITPSGVSVVNWGESLVITLTPNAS